jgi:mannose/cellobiose epimerase-like protein (N-acyl-D-glucosamine 2-epimerase family)
MSVYFRKRSFLLEHICHTLSFFYPRSFDLAGGFHQRYNNDGTVHDNSSSRTA